MDILDDFASGPKLAPIKYRFAAALLDFVILWIIAFVMMHFFGVVDDSVQNGVGYKLTGFPALVLFMIGFGLISLQEGYTGKTIGKRIMKISVTRDDFSGSSMSASIVRHLFDFIDLLFLVGIIVAASGQKKQRIGDLVAKTVVVRD